jgi:hypothetical protein
MCSSMLSLGAGRRDDTRRGATSVTDLPPPLLGALEAASRRLRTTAMFLPIAARRKKLAIAAIESANEVIK